MKIAVSGLGYVGLANAVLLSQNHEIVIFDIVTEKVNQLNQGITPIQDNEIEDFIANKDLNLRATSSKEDAYENADYVIVATPTNYDPDQHYFNTESVENVIKDVVSINSNTIIVIKSTVPVGFTDGVKKKFNYENIMFSPEFLREGLALHDNLYPSRIIIGGISENAKVFSELMLEGCLIEDVNVILTNSSDAEAIKLF